MTKKSLDPSQPIGIFDSGVGGLSILQAIQTELPHENLLYLGDQGHVPYGPQPKAEIRNFSVGITRFLLEQGAKLIVVACNTASAAALHHLREKFPSLPIVGMEPAVKPAAEHTLTGKVGVLATPTTFSGDLYTALVARFGKGITIFQSTCPGLVEQIESGKHSAIATRAILQKALTPMLKEKIDTIVLGCTHYPFVIPLIRDIAGQNIRIIDPSPAVARQTRRLLTQHGTLNPNGERGKVTFYTSGDPKALSGLITSLIGEPAHVLRVVWKDDTTLSASSS